MNIFNITNPAYAANGDIDVTLETEEFGVIPFTASSSDTEELGKTIYSDALSGKYGAIAPYVPPVITSDQQWRTVRATRNKLLQESDWTQLPDVPLATKEAWATYRQQLRDVTLQPDPFNIVWPTQPQ